MKHPDVKFQIVEIQKVGKAYYAVKVKTKRWLFPWRYVAYYQEIGEILLFNHLKEYKSKAIALQALNMYQQYGEIGEEEKIIQSN